jgi:hypothetical protein
MKYQIIGIRQPANPSKFNQIFAKDFIWVSFRNITKITQKNTALLPKALQHQQVQSI